MKKLIIIGCTIIAFAGCYNDKYDQLYPTPTPSKGTTNTCDTTTVSYTTEIKPIFDQSCNTSGCHAAGSGSTGYDFTDTTVLKTQAKNGSIVQDINFAPSGRGHNNMPYGGSKITACSINKITRWVNLGANCGN